MPLQSLTRVGYNELASSPQQRINWAYKEMVNGQWTGVWLPVPLAAVSAWDMRIGPVREPAKLRKTTGIVGADTFPNVTITWAATDMAVITPGHWRQQLWATEGPGRVRFLEFEFLVEAAVELPTP